MDITSATAGGPRWEDVDIPEFTTSGDASIPNTWGIGTLHERVSGSWT